MGADLVRRGFAIENEWYWRISENAQSFDAAGALRDFLTPLARCAKDVAGLAFGDLAAEGDEVRFTLGTEVHAIRIPPGTHDRVGVNHFVGDLNRILAASHYAFALVAPRRYELRGVLLTEDELAGLVGDPVLLVPSGRPSWRAIPAQ